MNAPENLLYSKSHEWVEFLSDDSCRVGITDFAQQKLGDIVFVNLPIEGDPVTQGESMNDVESVKAVAEIYSPVTGEIAQANEALDDKPELLNEDPYGAWIAEIFHITDKEELMDAAAYAAFCETEE